MNNEFTKIASWLFFGFLIVTAVDAIIYTLVHASFFLGVGSGISPAIIEVAVPLLTLFLYIISAHFVVKRIKAKLPTNTKVVEKFPNPKFWIGTLVIILLYPVTSLLSGVAWQKKVYEIATVDIAETRMAYLLVETGFTISRALILVIITVIFLKKYRSYQTQDRYKTSKNLTPEQNLPGTGNRLQQEK